MAMFFPSLVFPQIENDSPLTSRQNRRAVASGSGISSARFGDDKKPVKARIVQTRKREKVDAFKLMTDTVKPHVQNRSFPDLQGCDFQYYANVVKKHGWYIGIGKPLTKEHIKHLSCYFKLSRKGKTGPWTFMQAMNAYGRLTTSHNLVPYADYVGSKAGDWKERVGSVCQWETIGKDGVVLQECAYDENGELVYSYYPTSISPNEIIGHFTDNYGVRTTLRESETNGVSYIKITLDSLGYESRYDFLDGNGFYERNNGGNRFVTIVERDKDGNVVKNLTCDPYGRPIIDDYGNSGWISEYDGYGNATLMINLDEKGNPMKMPAYRTYENYAVKKNTYDQWERLIRTTYYDVEANPDTILTGEHSLVREYDDKGNLTLYYGKDLNGNLCNDRSGCAISVRKYDENGNQVLFARYTADSLFVNDSSGDCMTVTRYKNNDRVEQTFYSTTNGTDTVCNFHFISENGTKTYTNYADNWSVVRKYDSRGQQTEYAIYDAQMRPIMEEGYHKNLTKYVYGDKKFEKTDSYLDKQGRLVNMNDTTFKEECSCYVETIDSVTHVKTVEKYDQDMTLISKFSNKYNDDFSQVLEYWPYDKMGNRARTMRENAFFYGVKFVRNYRGEVISLQAFNEFGDPSYVLNGEWPAAGVYSTDIKQDQYYYDEFGDSIPSASKFKGQHCKAFCVEVIDSVGLANGLRSGDLLLQYGEWRYFVSERWNYSADNYLCTAIVNNANRKKEIAVMRQDPLTKTSRIINLTLGEGTPTQLGFVYHPLAMTKDEETHFDQVCKEYINEKGLNLSDYHTKSITYDQPRDVGVMKPYKINGKDQELCRRGFMEQTMVVGVKYMKDGKSNLYLVDNKIEELQAMLDCTRDSLIIYFTEDGKTLGELTTSEKPIDASFSITTVPGSLFGDLQKLTTEVKQRYEQGSGTKMERNMQMRSPAEVGAALVKRFPENTKKMRTADMLADVLVMKAPKAKCDVVLLDVDVSALDYQEQVALFDIFGHVDETGYKKQVDDDENTLYYKVKGDWITEMLFVSSEKKVLYVNKCKASVDEEESLLENLVKWADN